MPGESLEDTASALAPPSCTSSLHTLPQHRQPPPRISQVPDGGRAPQPLGCCCRPRPDLLMQVGLVNLLSSVRMKRV